MRVPVSGWIGLAAGLALLSCSSDKKTNGPNPDEAFPYAVPGVETMQVDTEGLGAPGTAGGEGLCHAASAVVVAWVNANVNARLAIPVAAFAACVGTTPVYLGDSTWRWTATAGQGSDMATGDLTAHLASSTQIDWEMRISGTVRGYDHFLWFSGSSDPAAASGVWRYYDPMSPTVAKEIVECRWTQPSAPGATGQVEFENVEAGNPDIGDRLRYRLVEHFASILYRNAARAESTTVSWDRITGEGSTTNPAGERCCWGSKPNFPDVVCPTAAGR